MFLLLCTWIWLNVLWIYQKIHADCWLWKMSLPRKFGCRWFCVLFLHPIAVWLNSCVCSVWGINGCMRCPFPLACMSVLPRPMARGMIKHVVIVFGGIYGNLVEPSLTNMARALVMTTPIQWVWILDLACWQIWKSCKFKRLCGSSIYPSTKAADSMGCASREACFLLKAPGRLSN